MERCAFGIDIGGTTIKIGMFHSDGQMKQKWEIPTRKDSGGSLILGDITEALRGACSAENIELEEIAGIGIGVPGAVINDRIVNKCVNIGWGVLDITAELEKLTGVSNIKVGNDANVAALGEMWMGGGKGHKNLVMVTLGTGVGSGVILDGKIVSGCFGAGGEIGHFCVNKQETISCGCGKRGCLEQYASATGIARKAKELLQGTSRPSALRSKSTLTAKDVFDEAKKGDELSLEVVEFVGDTLGAALACVSGVIDPEIYVIGGGVSKAGKILLDSIQKHFVKYVFHASAGALFELAALGNDAGMYGSVKMIL